MAQSDLLLTGRFVIASAIFWILQLIALALLYSGRWRFGPISDFSSAASAILLVPLALAFHELFGSGGQLTGLVAILCGTVGMVLVTATGLSMVAGMIEFRQSLPPVMIGMGLIGVWMVANSYLALDHPQIPPALAWLGVVIGSTLALALPAGLFWSADLHALMTGVAGQSGGGSDNPFLKVVVFIGGPINQLAFPVWAIWLGQLFLSGTFS